MQKSASGKVLIFTMENDFNAILQNFEKVVITFIYLSFTSLDISSQISVVNKVYENSCLRFIIYFSLNSMDSYMSATYQPWERLTNAHC